jgi:diguanylate cyclase (GGDEF)-like protein
MSVVGSRVRARRWLRSLQVVTGVLVIVYLLSTVLRTRGSSSPFYDGWIGNLAYGGCALLCAWRAFAIRAQRVAWSAIALSLGLFTTGAVLWTTVVQYWNPVPYPSVSDAFFLIFYPVAYVGVGLLIRDSMPRISRGVWIDGLIAALGLAALESAVVIDRISSHSQGDLPTVATNLAYPIGDLVLLMMLVALFAMHGWRPPRMWWLLGAGLAIFAVADTVYVLRVTSGTYVTGTPLDSLWLIGTFIIATAAWMRHDTTRAHELPRRPIVVPAVFTLSSLGIVVADGEVGHVDPFVVILASATLMLAVAWMAHSYRQLRTLATARREALTDELTGLGNRRMLTRQLGDRLDGPGTAGAATTTPLAVLIVDLDRFKEVNDAFGHPVGDELLAQLGPRLRRVLRSEDVLTRLGGDEFAVLLFDADRDHATDVGHRITEALREPFELRDVTVHTGASIGIVLSPEHSTDPDELLRCADVAMYRSKTRRTVVEVYDAGTDTSLDRFELIHELRAAVRNRDLVLHYQPQIDLHTGAVRSVEALARWRHPTRGYVPPDVFIPLAEEAMLMRPLTRLVLDEALAQCAEWERAGTPVAVAVNLSATNVLDGELLFDVKRLLRRHNLAPERLILEITEGVLLADPVRACRVITDLRAAGVAISVDDFGTGFSSLAYLRTLPVDELKLDRVFVTNLGGTDDSRDTAIARSALALGHALGLSVVAEGVEQPNTVNVLTELGFDAAQGFHLGRPVPAEEIRLTRSPDGTLVELDTPSCGRVA